MVTSVRIACSTLLSCLTWTLAHAQAPLTPADVLERRTLADPRFSPSGDRVAFTVTDPPVGETRNTDIWIYDLRARALRAFATSPASDVMPRWSPDGTMLAFVSDRAGTRQVYLIDTRGGEARPLTKQPAGAGVGMFAWSPDGRSIAFTSSDPRTEDAAKRIANKADARVVDRDERPARIRVIDVASGTVRAVTAGTWDLSGFEWMPNGQALVASGTDTPDPNRQTERLVRVEIADGQIRTLVPAGKPISGIAVSPDGAWLAFSAPRLDGPQPHDLWIMPASGGEAHNLTGASVDRQIGGVVWRSPTALTVTAADGFRTQLIDLTTDGTATPRTALPVMPSAIDVARDGTLAFVGQTTTEPPELWVQSGSQAPERVSGFNAPWKAAHAGIVPATTFTYKSFDGTAIEASWLAPAGYNSNTRYPLVVLVHGGPTGRWSDAFEPWGQLLAARGYAVLYPNVRGSTGYGHTFVEANRADWGGGDWKDVIAGVDAMIARGIADSTRMGIGGWSYGGYMAMWAVTQTNRFRASVAGAGMSDLASEFGTENSALYDEWFFGTPYEHQNEFIESSPITFVRHARTPTLILQGENDTTDPIGQSQQFYRGLRKYNVPSDFVLYPREGHGIREQQHMLDLYTRVIDWYDRWLRSPATTP